MENEDNDNQDNDNKDNDNGDNGNEENNNQDKDYEDYYNKDNDNEYDNNENNDNEDKDKKARAMKKTTSKTMTTKTTTRKTKIMKTRTTKTRTKDNNNNKDKEPMKTTMTRKTNEQGRVGVAIVFNNDIHSFVNLVIRYGYFAWVRPPNSFWAKRLNLPILLWLPLGYSELFSCWRFVSLIPASIYCFESNQSHCLFDSFVSGDGNAGVVTR